MVQFWCFILAGCWSSNYNDVDNNSNNDKCNNIINIKNNDENYNNTNSSTNNNINNDDNSNNVNNNNNIFPKFPFRLACCPGNHPLLEEGFTFQSPAAWLNFPPKQSKTKRGKIFTTQTRHMEYKKSCVRYFSTAQQCVKMQKILTFMEKNYFTYFGWKYFRDVLASFNNIITHFIKTYILYKYKNWQL